MTTNNQADPGADQPAPVYICEACFHDWKKGPGCPCLCHSRQPAATPSDEQSGEPVDVTQFSHHDLVMLLSNPDIPAGFGVSRKSLLAESRRRLEEEDPIVHSPRKQRDQPTGTPALTPDKYVTFHMTMRMKDPIVEQFPEELKSSLILEIFKAAQEAAALRKAWIVGGGTGLSKREQEHQQAMDALKTELEFGAEAFHNKSEEEQMATAAWHQAETDKDYAIDRATTAEAALKASEERVTDLVAALEKAVPMLRKLNSYAGEVMATDLAALAIKPADTGASQDAEGDDGKTDSN